MKDIYRIDDVVKEKAQQLAKQVTERDDDHK